MSKLLLILFILLLSCFANAQKQIRTEVFSLSTCDPGQVSLIKQVAPGSPDSEQINKLEARSNKPSIFQISGINPLRYKYYINNEAVTQFMEASPLTLSINSFVNSGFFVTAPEIKVPEIFKTDSISSQVKIRIREFQAQKKALDESNETAEAAFNTKWTAILAEAGEDYTKARAKALIDPEYKKLLAESDQVRSRMSKSLMEYEAFIAGLPVNNPSFAIVAEYRRINLADRIDPSIDSIRQVQREYGIQSVRHIKRFKTIDSILASLERDNFATLHDNDPRLLQLEEKLRFYNFTIPVNRDQSKRYDPKRFQVAFQYVREQVLQKKFQLYEEFVLHVATRIGVLVQNQFREFSSFNNLLESLKCIDSSTLVEIHERKKKLNNTFQFIQQTSAELQVMVSYMDINTVLYQNIAKKINDNYLFLLTYLKNLDFVCRENAFQYTLPTHTNLRNIDLIRYTVSREDKITKNTQTYNYDFWVRGGLKIDFSVGFFATRLTDKVYNKVLLGTANDVDNIRITQQDDGRTSFAFGGMVNVAQRNGASWANIGGSIGIAYSGNQKIQALAGLSLHLGKTERLILHGGVGFGTVKTLDISANDFKFFDRDLKQVPREKINDVKERDRVYMLQSADIKYSSFVIPTIEKFVARPFFGISYNLSKKNALQAVSGTGLSTYSENLKTAGGN